MNAEGQVYFGLEGEVPEADRQRYLDAVAEQEAFDQAAALNAIRLKLETLDDH